MRRTLSSLRALERDLERLEARAEGDGELSGREQTALWMDAVFGDARAAEKFERAHAEGRITPILWRLFELERQGPNYGPGAEVPR